MTEKAYGVILVRLFIKIPFFKNEWLSSSTLQKPLFADQKTDHHFIWNKCVFKVSKIYNNCNTATFNVRFTLDYDLFPLFFHPPAASLFFLSDKTWQQFPSWRPTSSVSCSGRMVVSIVNQLVINNSIWAAYRQIILSVLYRGK